MRTYKHGQKLLHEWSPIRRYGSPEGQRVRAHRGVQVYQRHPVEGKNGNFKKQEDARPFNKEFQLQAQ